jgi:mannose-6-phosphate isomerase-like protein (cupin superfamily)
MGGMMMGEDAQMSDFTVVNLREVEDMAPKGGMSPGMEARFARVPLELEQSGLSYFKVAPDYRTGFGHTHSEQEEVYLVIRGSLVVKVGDEEKELREWDAIRIAPGATHSFAGGPDGAEIVAYGAPNTENKDADLIKDWWGD